MGETKRPAAQRRHGSPDDFQTDPRELIPLMPFLRPHKRILEPFAGEGFLVNYLMLEGHRVQASDLKVGVDFLTADYGDDWDALASNPPYSVKNKIVERCYDLGKPFALFMPYTAMETEKRQKFYRRYGLEILVMHRRPMFKTPSGKWGGSWFPAAWFCHRILPEKIVWASDVLDGVYDDGHNERYEDPRARFGH